MNKIFRVIWSAATGNWVVVSEISKASVSKPGSVYASEKRLNRVLVPGATGSGRLKLTELAIAFCLAGLWAVASPALAAPLKASLNAGTELASSRCGTGANATNVAGIAVGCGAQAVSGTVSVLDRRNPFENRNDLRFSTSNGGLLETQSIAIGEASYAGKSAIAVGGRSNATDDFATAMGVWARAQGKSSVAIGPRTLATGNTSLALGRESVASADFAQAIGNVSAATGTSSLAIGHSATATGLRSIAIGGADRGSEIVGGQRGVTYQAQSLTKAEGIGSIALGGGARATMDRAVALGERAQATRADAVALGSASDTNAAATAINNATVGGHAYTGFAGVVSNPSRVLSVGAAGAERQIKNVGSGEISATSTDAVNGSQLYAIASRQGGGMNFLGDANTNGSTVGNDRKVEIPSGGNLNITGGVTNPGSLLNDQIGVVADPAGKTLNVRLRKDLNLGSDGSLSFGTNGPNLSNIGLNMNNKKITGLNPGTAGADAVNVSQLNGVKATADNAMTEVSKGWNVQANGDVASKVAPGNTVQFIDGANIDITRQGNNVTVATSPILTADSLSINNQGPVLNTTGIAMGGKKITGLVNGTAPNDAVNLSQLDAVKSRADDALLHAGTALIQANTAITEASKGWNLQANGDTVTKVAPGDTVQFNDGNNINVTRNGNDLTIATSADLTADSLTFNNGGPVLNAGGIDMGGKKITGLADGAAPTDAVSVSQLNGVKAVADNAMAEASKGFNLQTNGDTATKVAPGDTVQFINGANIEITRAGNDITISTAADLTADSLTINNGGPVLNAGGIDMGGKKLTGLADGAAPTDAVNFSQLNGVKAVADNAMAEASKGFNLQTNGDTATKVAPGDTVQFINGANIDMTRAGNNITIATATDLTADSLTINNGGLALNADGIDMGGKIITGLADGTAPNDAVNLSQLDGVKVVADDALTQAGNAIVEAGRGWNLQANGDAATKVAPGDTVQFIDGNNINVTRNGNDLTISTSADLTADSLTINNGGPVLNAGGIDMGGKKITGLDDGAAPTDAVNFSQLDSIKAVVDNAMVEVLKGFNLQTNGDTATKVAPGDTVQFIDGTNIDITRAGNDITIATAADLIADSLTINNGGPVLNADGIDMDGKKITGLADGIAPNDAVNFSQLGGVKSRADDALTQAGNAIVEASKGWNLQANGDTATKVAPGDTVQFIDGNNINVTRNGNDLTISTSADLTADSLTINNGGPVLNAGGIDMGGKKITDLADGTAPTDAVNFSQLDGVKDVADSAMAEASKGFNLQVNGDTATKVSPGDTVQFIDGHNINVIRNGNDLTIATATDLTTDSLSINNGGPVLDVDGINMNDKKLTNVAPGTLSADSKDAVNASQLFTVGNSTAAALGGNSTFNPDTGVVTPSLQVGDKNFTNVNDALDDLNTTLAATTAEASKGWSLQANGDTATKVAPGDIVQFIDGTNIDITRAGNDITFATTADLTADSLSINNAGPVLNVGGIDMGGKKITGLADGTAPTDAVSYSQLDGVKTVADNAIAEVSKGWNLQANGDTATKVALGDTVQFIGGTNIDITRAGNDITIATTADLTADGLTINNGGPFIHVDGINMNDNKLTNVGPGTLSADSKDGINASQLFAIGNSTAAALGGNSTFDSDTGVVIPSLQIGEKNFTNVNDALGDLNTTLADTVAEASKGWSLQANDDTATKVAPGDTVHFNDGTNIDITRVGNDIAIATAADLTAESLTINNGGPVLSSAGIDMVDKKLTNVASGVLSADSKDGVNASQLFAVGNSTAAALGGNSAFNPDTGAVTPSLQVGDKNYTNVNDALDDLNTTLAATTAEASKGWNLQANGDTATKVAPGDTVQLIDGTNIDITRSGNDITISTAADLTAESLNINNGGPVLNAGGIDMGGKKITGLADGTAPTDAVSFSQLDGVKTMADNAMAEASKGFNLQANGDTATKVAPGGTVQFIDGTNINVTRNGNDVTVATVADLTAESLTINNGGPVFNVDGINMNDKKLTNVAAGTLSADSKDGVNASQLFAVGNSTAAALGGNSTFSPDTGIVTPSLQVGDKNFTNVNDALGDLNTTLAATTAEASKGWNLQANGDTATKVAPGDTVQLIDGTNIDITRSGNDITIATSADLTAESLTINNGGPVLNVDGINMNDKKLTNVAAGTLSADSKDGVNASQLFAMGNSTAAAFGGNSTFSPESGVVTPSLQVGDKNFTNVNDALGDLNTTLAATTAEASKGWNLQANGDTATKVAPGDTVHFIDGTNIDITRSGNDITIATAADLAADSLIINNGGPVVNASGIDMGGKKITGLADGNAPTDAVSFSQLDGVKTVADNALAEASKGWNLQTNGDAATKVAPGDTVQFIDGTNINVTRNGSDVTVATVANLTADSLTINNGGPVVNVDGVNMNDKKLTNVAVGTLSADSKDGVNASQLFAVGSSTATALGGNSTFSPESGVVTPSLQVGDKSFTNVNDALDDLNTTLAAATVQASKGWSLQANGDTATKVAPGDTVQFIDGTNIVITRAGNDITIATAADLTADSLTINNGGPVVNAGGIDMGGKKITGLADGTAPTDAVSFSQLDGVKTVADNAVAEASKGWNLQTNGDAATKVAPGDTVQFIDGTNIDITRSGNDLTLATSSDLTADSLTINNGGPVFNVDGINMIGKKITNLAAGTLSADSKDGVNASQLFAMGNSTAAAFGGNSTFNPDTGAVTPSLQVGDKNFTNVNDALTDLNSTLAATTVEASKGWNLQTNGDAADKVAPDDTVQFIDGTNIDITRVGNDITIATAADLTADSLTIDNGGPVIHVDGINMNDKNVTNVAPGTLSADSKDAVNASQLFAVGKSTAAALGGNSAFNPDTGVVTSSLQVGDKNFTNVNDALGDLNTTLAATTAEASKGWNLQANGDAASKVAPGGTVQLIDGTNIDITRAGSDVTIATAADLTGDSLTLNNGGPVLSSAGIEMSDKKLTNVAAGTLAPDSKDGVNASQLFAVGTSTAEAFGGNSTFDPVSGIVTPSLTVGDKNFSNVNDALGDLNTTLASTTAEASKGWNLQANGDSATKVAPGDTVQFIDGTNIEITRNGNDLTFSTSADLTAESLTINNGGPVFNVDGINMNDKKLTNVAAGTLSTESKDGVNASQLFAVGNSTAAAFGGNSTFDPASGIVTPSLTVGDKNFSNVNDALGDLNTTLAVTTTEASKGWNLQANGDTATKVAPGDTVQFIDGTNIDIIRNGNEITIATVADLTADSLTFNNGGPVLSSTGIDLSDKKLTNVSAGTLSADSKDGVNASQLFAAGSSTAAAFGGDSTYDPETGEVRAGLKVGDQLFTSVNNALDAINNNVGTVARRGWDIAGADGIVANVATGGQVRFVAGNEHTKVGVTQDNGVSTVTVSAASSPLQYTQANQANGKNDPIADPFIKTNSVTLVGQDTTAPVSLNNVARATLSADSVQAVNGQQLYGLGQSIASTLGGDTRFNAETGQLDTTIRIGNNSYHNVADALSSIGEAADRGWQLQLNNDTPQNVAAGSTVGFNQGSNMQLTRDGNQITFATVPNVTFESVKTDRMEGDTISAKSYLGVIDGPALTQSGIDAAGKPITNLKPGEIAEGSTDAVTGGQLHSLAGGTAAALNRLQGNLDRVAKDANAGSATAGAMANLPQAYLPGKSMFSLATARYVGQQGFAAGLSKVSENGNWIIKGSVSGNTRGKTMIGAGIGYQW